MSKHRRRSLTKAASSDITGTPTQRTSVAPMTTAGVSGTPVYGGYIDVKEQDPRLVGTKKWETFGEIMLNVSIVASGVRYYLNLMSQPGWKAIAPDKSGAQGEQIAEHVQYCMDKMETPWSRVVRRGSLFRTHGYSIQEWTARPPDERSKGRICMADVESRPQHTIQQWDTTVTGKVLGVVQLSPHDGRTIYLPRSKIIYIVDDALTDSPEGSGLLRHLAEPTRILRRYQQLEGWGFETDLRGIPIGRAPFAILDQMVKNNELTKEQRETILAPMEKFLKGHIKTPQLGLLMDSMVYEGQDEAATPSPNKHWDLDLLKSSSVGQQEVANAIERMMRDIARVLGVEHLLMGDNGVGSFAMAKDKSHNFALMIDAALRDVRQAYEKDFVRPIMLLNGWPEELTPSLQTDKLQYRSVEQLTTSLADMARAGAMLMPDDPAILQVRDLMGLQHPITIQPLMDAALTPKPPKE